ncbi:MAG TPA: DUF488 family protein [Polyangiaceae bacterium]
MTLLVQTARLGYIGDDWLDVSLQGNTRREGGGHRGIGLFFAPSPGLLYPYLSKRKFKRETPALWERYASDYTAEMRSSFRRYRKAWDMLLAFDRVVLLCFCTDSERCHRTVLGRDILPTLGADYAGEVRAA